MLAEDYDHQSPKHCPPDWPPDPASLDVQVRNQGRDDRPASIVVQHPTAPFPANVNLADDLDVQAGALTYLRSAVDAIERVEPLTPLIGTLLDGWFRDLDPGGDPETKRFGWAPIVRRRDDKEQNKASMSDDDKRPLASFVVDHIDKTDASGARRRDQTLVLIASERLNGKLQGSEFGIRIIAQVEQGDDGGPAGLRFTGFAAALPFGVYATSGAAKAVDFDAGRELRRFRNLLARPLHLDPESCFFCGFRVANVDGGVQAEVTGRGLEAQTSGHAAPAGGSDRRLPYSLIAEFFVPRSDGTPKLRWSKRTAMVGDAHEGEADVFKRDPASWRPVRHPGENLTMRRPTRDDPTPVPGDLNPSPSPGDLNEYREPLTIPVIPEVPNTPLKEDGVFEVRTSRFVYAEGDDSDVRHVHLPADDDPDYIRPRPRIRSHDFSAVSAFEKTEAILDHLDFLGIVLDDYFRSASLPLYVHYRSGVRPGPGKDGITVNARVLPRGWDPKDIGPRCDRPALDIHLAMANLSHRERQVWDRRNRSQAEYMGIAADPRWIWHEFGHVLLMASIGALELPFAHSPGDALAAIASDPYSELATDLDHPRARGATFPWVFLNRRHDRNVLRGWSWSGSQQRGVREQPDSKRWDHKGYWSEQILSSSLFRMYRCLGGDTVLDGDATMPDRPARAFASDYALFLIVRAFENLGCGCLVSAVEPEDLVQSLICVDIVTESFTGRTPEGGGAAPFRIGGCAHKVIRWAFEAQGLYPEDPGANTNAPGLPPSVDIFIPDRRPEDEVLPDGPVHHGQGGYVPVSLHWPGSEATFDRALWTAGDEGIRLIGDQIHVTVRNHERASEIAAQVSVRLWRLDLAAWPAEAPDWDDSVWTELALTSSGPEDIPPGEARTFTFGPFVPAAGPSLVFAEATCEQDRANTLPTTLLPCCSLTVPSRPPNKPLIDLVSGDNNLGLTLIATP